MNLGLTFISAGSVAVNRGQPEKTSLNQYQINMMPNRDADPPNTKPNHGVDDRAKTSSEDYSTNQPQDSRNPTHSAGFTMIPPNESKRNKMLSMRQKELDDLQKLKEECRPGPIQQAPERLGGALALSDARGRQQAAGHQSKLKKKLKKQEMDRSRKEAEEEENQKMMATQREKANQLEIKKKKEEQERKELYQLDLLTLVNTEAPKQQQEFKQCLFEQKREAHLQKLEQSSSVPMAASSSTPTSSWARGYEYRESIKAQEQLSLQQKKDEQRKKSQILEEKHQQEEEDRKSQMEKERLRVNSAFLDSLEARGSGRASELHPCTPELGNVWQMREPQDPGSSPVSFPSQLHTDSAEEEDANIEWVVMKLQSIFSYYEREYLEDIASQCNGNFQQAYDLLNA